MRLPHMCLHVRLRATAKLKPLPGRASAWSCFCRRMLSPAGWRCMHLPAGSQASAYKCALPQNWHSPSSAWCPAGKSCK